MNVNTYGNSQAATNLVHMLEDGQVEHKVTRLIGRILSRYNRGLDFILKVEDAKVKAQLLALWRQEFSEEFATIPASVTIITHIKNVALAHLRNKKEHYNLEQAS